MRRRIDRKKRRVLKGISDNLPRGQMIWIGRSFFQTVIHARRISQQTGIPLSQMFCEGLSFWIGQFKKRAGGDIERAIRISNEEYEREKTLKRERRKRIWEAFKKEHPGYVRVKFRKANSAQNDIGQGIDAGENVAYNASSDVKTPADQAN